MSLIIPLPMETLNSFGSRTWLIIPYNIIYKSKFKEGAGRDGDADK